MPKGTEKEETSGKKLVRRFWDLSRVFRLRGKMLSRQFSTRYLNTTMLITVFSESQPEAMYYFFGYYKCRQEKKFRTGHKGV